MNSCLKMSPQHFDPAENANSALGIIRMPMDNNKKNCCETVWSVVHIHFEYNVHFYLSAPKIVTWNLKGQGRYQEWTNMKGHRRETDSLEMLRGKRRCPEVMEQKF